MMQCLFLQNTKGDQHRGELTVLGDGYSNQSSSSYKLLQNTKTSATYRGCLAFPLFLFML